MKKPQHVNVKYIYIYIKVKITLIKRLNCKKKKGSVVFTVLWRLGDLAVGQPSHVQSVQQPFKIS